MIGRAPSISVTFTQLRPGSSPGWLDLVILRVSLRMRGHLASIQGSFQAPDEVRVWVQIGKREQGRGSGTERFDTTNGQQPLLRWKEGGKERGRVEGKLAQPDLSPLCSLHRGCRSGRRLSLLPSMAGIQQPNLFGTLKQELLNTCSEPRTRRRLWEVRAFGKGGAWVGGGNSSLTSCSHHNLTEAQRFWSCSQGC